ncbi:hypothetical protein L2K20_18170 [Mycobacterium sp. MBM]|nr:hypothetical protein [Mycobacterium sp. MBM]
MFDTRSVASHLDAARDQLRAERTAVAAKILAAGRFALARMAELGHAFEDLIVDDWELAAAELGAELGISRGRACTLITQGRDLLTGCRPSPRCSPPGPWMCGCCGSSCTAPPW